MVYAGSIPAHITNLKTEHNAILQSFTTGKPIKG